MGAGDRISAAWARGLTREVERLGRVRGGAGVSVVSSAAGILITAGGDGGEGGVMLGRVVERLGGALDGNGRGLGGEVWYRVEFFGRPDLAGVEVPPDRIFRALETSSPARLTPFAVGAYVPLLVIPRRRRSGDAGSVLEREVWIVCGERYFSAVCGSNGA
jgi:hypothetical protein